MENNSKESAAQLDKQMPALTNLFWQLDGVMRSSFLNWRQAGQLNYWDVPMPWSQPGVLETIAANAKRWLMCYITCKQFAICTPICLHLSPHRAMYKTSSSHQLTFEDFNQSCGMKLDLSNEWCVLAKRIDWAKCKKI